MRIYFIYDRCQQGGIYIKTYSVCGPEDTFGFGARVRNNRHCMQDNMGNNQESRICGSRHAWADVCAVKVKCNRQYRIRTGEFICLFLYGYDMFCGSVNNSVIFETDEEAYVMLREVRCNPADYFRMVILRKNITEFISFWLVFSVFGMNVAKALYLTIVIVGSRYAGEAFNIMMFKATAKPFSMHRKGNIAVMLLSLFVAYLYHICADMFPGHMTLYSIRYG